MPVTIQTKLASGDEDSDDDDDDEPNFLFAWWPGWRHLKTTLVTKTISPLLPRIPKMATRRLTSFQRRSKGKKQGNDKVVLADEDSSEYDADEMRMSHHHHLVTGSRYRCNGSFF
jgi:hypothetical protein